MEFVESLIALLCSFLFGLLIEWVFLRGLFKLMAKQPPKRMPAARETAK